MTNNKLADTIINLPMFSDERGSLTFAESNNHLPFPVRRIFYITNTPQNGNRGHHAHKITNQVLFCLQGSVLIKLDDGKNKTEYLLNKPNVGIIVRNRVWHSMENFSKNAVLLVVASTHYNENEYIRNYDDFIKFITK